MIAIPTKAIRTRPDFGWHSLRVLCGYRLAVAALLLGSFALSVSVGVLPALRPLLFLQAAGGYLLLALLALGLTYLRRPQFEVQVHGQMLLDVAAIAALVHAYGNLESGLGVLMIVAVASGALLAGPRLGAFFAALATLALLLERVFSDLQGTGVTGGYTQVGLLGIATFATAIGGGLLARRARASALLAERRGLDVANLEALNAHIVQRMETGVVAVNPAGGVRLANRVARELFGDADLAGEPSLEDVSPALAAAYRRWQQSWESGAEPLHGPGPGAGSEFMPRFHPLGTGGEPGTLIFLENLTAMRAQVQQAKLASLGRLTASIAHEIRNPLAAMLQGAQLLGEADYLKQGDRRLVGIIDKQGRRLNKTIENVLQLSRREPPQRQSLDLGQWLTSFVQDWRDEQGPSLGEVDLKVEVDADTVEALCDPDHLQQVLDNLVRNAVEHAGGEDRRPRVVLRAYWLTSEQPVLEVRDNGPGIAAEIHDHLFEPFATTRSSGTGLGLYLAGELCEANQARIRHDTDVTDGACFRILFAPAPQRTKTP